MQKDKVVVIHDRNLGLVGPLLSAGIIPDRVFITEPFTEKLIKGNIAELPHYARIPEDRDELYDEISLVDFLFTAPFCAPFSNLNRTYVAPGMDDPMKHPKVADAVEMVDLAVQFKPRVFTMESVARAADFMREHFVPRLIRAGYNVLLWRFDSYMLGLPQSRPRMLLMAMQQEEGNWNKNLISQAYEVPDMSRETDKRRVWNHLTLEEESDILPTLPHEHELWELTPRGHKLRTTFKKAVGDMDHPGPGLGLVKLHPDGLSVVISQSSDLFHPGIPRRLTTGEVLSLLSFPTNLKVPGSQKNVYRIGNGVPFVVGSKMLRVIGSHINKAPDNTDSTDTFTEINWAMNRQEFLYKDPWPEDLFGSKPEWTGQFYKARGWTNDRSQRTK